MSITEICLSCRQPISTAATACRHCGAAALQCPQCGSRSRIGSRFCSRCGTTLTADSLQPGQTLQNGAYTVIRTLSRGGMGQIYLARDHRAFDRDVVLKALLDYADPHNPAEVQAARERFINEARTLAELDHPAIPKIFTYLHEADRNYIVMAFINGTSLDQLVTAGAAHPVSTPVDHDQVRRWGSELCQVLEYLAERRPPVVHQDIKPANIIRDQHGALRLVDFGTARVRTPAGPTSAAGPQSAVFGTPGYAPPEQYRGRSEPRSDVYALAATLYHLATDDDPTQHPQQFPQLDRLGDLGRVLRAALQPEPHLRPTAQELRRQLTPSRIPAQPAATPAAAPYRLRQLPDGLLPPLREARLLRLSDDRRLAAVADPSGYVTYWTIDNYARHHHRVSIGGTGTALGWNRDGTLLAIGSSDRRLLLLDVATNRIVNQLRCSTDLRDIAAAESTDAFFVLDRHGVLSRLSAERSDAQPLAAAPAGPGAYSCLARHPADTRLVLGTSHGGLELRDGRDGRLLMQYSGHASAVTALTWEPHGERFASVGADGHLRIWRSQDDRQIGGNLLSRRELLSLSWSADGCWLAAAGVEQRIFAYDTIDGQAIHDLSGYSGDIGSVTFVARGLDLLACGSAAQQALTRWQIRLKR